jgi:hypothetical protein
MWRLMAQKHRGSSYSIGKDLLASHPDIDTDLVQALGFWLLTVSSTIFQRLHYTNKLKVCMESLEDNQPATYFTAMEFFERLLTRTQNLSSKTLEKLVVICFYIATKIEVQ